MMISRNAAGRRHGFTNTLAGAAHKMLRLAVILILMTLITSCHRPDGGETDTGTVQEMPAVQEISGLTDLTGYAQKAEGTLCAYALSDDSHLMLLTLCGDHYKAFTMDLGDGSVSEQSSFPCAQNTADGGVFVEILSTDPLVVYDSSGMLLYQPQAADPAAQQFFVPDWMPDASFRILDGKVYLSSDRGIVSVLNDDGTTDVVWRLPRQFRHLTPFPVSEDGILTYVTQPSWDDRHAVYIDLDPVTGEYSLREAERRAPHYAAGDGGRAVSISQGHPDALTLYDYREETERVLTLPEEVLSADAPADPASEDYIVTDTAPLGLHGNLCCFSFCNSRGNPVRLFLWDYLKTPAAQWIPPQTAPCPALQEVSYGELSERAQALEETYGVSVVMGENVPAYFDDYQVEIMTDEQIMDGMLSVLENSLALYPPHFFDNLKSNYYRDVVIYLTGAMTPQDAGSNITNAGAFTTESDGLCEIAFNLQDDPAMCTVVHEMVHAVDYRLAGEALLDEEEWNAMNPEGFTYYDGYIDENGESYELSGDTEYTMEGGGVPDEIWFIDAYSKTYPMEDRARLVEYLLARDDPPNDCYHGVHIQQKLQYYFRLLREVLADGDWPPVTAWEQALLDME